MAILALTTFAILWGRALIVIVDPITGVGIVASVKYSTVVTIPLEAIETEGCSEMD